MTIHRYKQLLMAAGIMAIMASCGGGSSENASTNLLDNCRKYLMVRFDGDEYYSLIDKDGKVLSRNQFDSPTQVHDDLFWDDDNVYRATNPDEKADIDMPLVFENGVAYAVSLTDKGKADIENMILYTSNGKKLKLSDFKEATPSIADAFYLYADKKREIVVFNHSGKHLGAIERKTRKDKLASPSDEGHVCLMSHNDDETKTTLTYYNPDGKQAFELKDLEGGGEPSPMIGGKVCFGGSIYDKQGNAVFKGDPRNPSSWNTDSTGVRAERPLGNGLYVATRTDCMLSSSGYMKFGRTYYGVIDEKGNEVIPIKYRGMATNLEKLGDYYVLLTQDFKWVLVDGKGVEKKLEADIVGLSKISLNKSETGKRAVYNVSKYNELFGETVYVDKEGDK